MSERPSDTDFFTSREVSPWPPQGWRIREDSRSGRFSIRGWDSQVGVSAALSAGFFLVSFLLNLGWLMALLGVLTCILAGLGWGYHLSISPGGILYQRTWYGLPLRHRQLPLHTRVSEWWALEQDEPEGIVLEGEPPIHLSAAPRTTTALRRAVQGALEHAQGAHPSST